MLNYHYGKEMLHILVPEFHYQACAFTNSRAQALSFAVHILDFFYFHVVTCLCIVNTFELNFEGAVHGTYKRFDYR